VKLIFKSICIWARLCVVFRTQWHGLHGTPSTTDDDQHWETTTCKIAGSLECSMKVVSEAALYTDSKHVTEEENKTTTNCWRQYRQL